MAKRPLKITKTDIKPLSKAKLKAIRGWIDVELKKRNPRKWLWRHVNEYYQ